MQSMLGTYINGNYRVILLEDGTKIRVNNLKPEPGQDPEDCFIAEFPESMDICITRKCDRGCPMCYAGCTPDGVNADIMNAAWIESLHPWTEAACLDGDTIVHTNSGSKRISDIHVGDKVFDSDHKLRTVTNISVSRKEAFELKGKRGMRIVASADHPFISNGVEIHTENMLNRPIDLLTPIAEINDSPVVVDMARWIKPASELEGSRGGKILADGTVRLRNCTTPIPRHVLINEDVMWLYGLFVAEGSCKGIVLNISEDDIANRAIDIWERTFNQSAHVYRNEEKKSLTVEFYQASLIEDFIYGELLLEKGSQNVSLKYLYGMQNKELVRSALMGLFEGDGCFRERKNGHGGTNYITSFKTASMHLAYDISYFLMKWFGICATVHHGMNRPRRIEGRALPETDYYTVEFYGYENTMKFFDDNASIVKPLKSKTINSTSAVVEKISPVGERDLYDITLDSGSHVFPVNGIFLTHNCGGGNIFEHPDLIPFLNKLYEQNVIANITLNQQHFIEHIDDVMKLSAQGLVKGVGVSVFNPTEQLINYMKAVPNTVAHCIAGVVDESVLKPMMYEDLRLLLLGYKTTGRGASYSNHHYGEIGRKMTEVENMLPELFKSFRVVSFDNMALKQLHLKDHLTEEQWNRFYMGDDGIEGKLTSATMYVDMPSNSFAVNSMAVIRHRINDDDTVDTMFQYLKNHM